MIRSARRAVRVGMRLRLTLARGAFSNFSVAVLVRLAQSQEQLARRFVRTEPPRRRPVRRDTLGKPTRYRISGIEKRMTHPSRDETVRWTGRTPEKRNTNRH